MADFVQMRNWQQFWNDYIYEGQKAGLKNEEIRRNLIEAFRKEIFGLVMFRAKVEDLDDIPQTPENSEMLRNIFRQEQNKWKKLVQECKKHRATAMLIREDDLTLFDKPEEDDEDGGYEFCEAEDPEEEEESEEVDEMTAEWPELSENFDDIEPAGIEGLDDIQKAMAENMEEAFTSGYAQVEEPQLPEVGQEFPAGYWTK